MDDLNTRIDAYFDGALDKDQADELRQWVSANPANARHFADRAMLHHQIRSILSRKRIEEFQNKPDMFSELLAIEDAGESAIVDISDKIRRETQEKRRKSAEVKRRKTMANLTNVETKHYVIPKPLFYGSIAAVIAIAALIIWPMVTPERPEPQPVGLHPVAPPMQVATLVAMIDATWEDPNQRTTPGSDIFDSPLTLASGAVRLRFNNGAELMIEAPASFTPAADDRIELHSGKLVGYCNVDAHGFKVVTDGVVFEDLGTEFAVDATDPSNSEVHVFDGAVRAMARQGGDVRAQDIESGRAVRLSHRTGETHEIELSPQKFAATQRESFRVDNTGLRFREGDRDWNWKITKVSTDPDFDGRDAVVVNERPLGRHLVNDPERSQWISLTPGPVANETMYTFETNFDLPEQLDPDTASLRVRLIVDDEISDIRLNGQSVTLHVRGRIQENFQFREFFEFEIDESFIKGRNDLEIDVLNVDIKTDPTSTPMALRVELEGSARTGVWWKQ